MSSNLFRLLEEAVDGRSELVAISHPVGGKFQELRWKEVYERVQAISSGLISLDVAQGDRIAIISKTRLEWTLTDLAILGVGAVTVPLYHSINDEDFHFILKDCDASVLFVENVEFLNRLRKFREQLPRLKVVIVIDSATELDKPAGELSFSEFIHFSEGRDDAKEMQSRLEKVAPDDIATIVYTSGTTGVPKGAMVTHDNLMYEAHAIEKLGIISSSEIQLLFLPLAHIFARILQFAWLKTRHVLFFAEDFDRLADNIRTVRPTIIAGVPRVFEKIHAKIVQKGLSSPGFKKRLVKWAFERAEDRRKREMAGESNGGIAWTVADLLVFSKIKTNLEEVFGGRLRFLISGGAALAPEINYFFKYAGVTILEGWGLTETTAATCLNLPTSNKIGTVGKPVPGTELNIAEDGEILVKGRGVFKGYWKNEEATKAAFDENGFFRTGDVGIIQPGGFLKITDRKKDIIVTAGGKKVAPQKIEGLYKSASPLISQILAVGDGKPYLVGLVALDGSAVEEFARENKIKGSFASITQNKILYFAIEAKISEVNLQLSGFEQVKKFVILDHEFVVGEQLTPTQKVKRKYCTDKYAPILKKLYGDAKAL